MAITKIFKNGNSQAVRIPAELAYSTWDIDLVIERQGDELRIRPAQVAFEARAASAYGPARFANRDRSRDALDKLIAAHAIALGVTLVTNNEADFAMYPGLVVENWVDWH